MFLIRREDARRHRSTCQNLFHKNFERLDMSLRDRRPLLRSAGRCASSWPSKFIAGKADQGISITSASTAARIFHLQSRSATTNGDVILARRYPIKDPEGGLTLEGPPNLRPMHLGATATSKLYKTMTIEI